MITHTKGEKTASNSILKSISLKFAVILFVYKHKKIGENFKEFSTLINRFEFFKNHLKV